jgi:hypothetical protein
MSECEQPLSSHLGVEQNDAFGRDEGINAARLMRARQHGHLALRRKHLVLQTAMSTTNDFAADEQADLFGHSVRCQRGHHGGLADALASENANHSEVGLVFQQLQQKVIREPETRGQRATLSSASGSSLKRLPTNLTECALPPICTRSRW